MRRTAFVRPALLTIALCCWDCGPEPGTAKVHDDAPDLSGGQEQYHDEGDAEFSGKDLEDPGEPDADTTPDPGEADEPGLTFGQPCANDEECASGVCAEARDGFYCSKFCSTADECPEGMDCRSIEGFDTPICSDVHARICSPCMSNSECALGPGSGSRCYSPGSGPPGMLSFCFTDCSQVPCPQGYECKGLFAEGQPPLLHLCAPPGYAKCTCSAPAITRGAKTRCSWSSSGIGTCNGWVSCTEAGLMPCDAIMPLPEQCDGIDNDCDGTTDEDFLDLDHDGQANCVDPDRDGDGVPEDGDGSGAAGDHPCSTGHVAGCDDNCPWTPNPNQIDSDSDGVGDACEGIDQDGDGIPDDLDNCPADHNPGQEDNEGDGFGDACDPDDDNDGDPDVTDCYPFNELIHHGTEDFPDWLGIDSNCDGIDGEIQKGLFVSPAGGDAGDGSQASPFHSIGVAIGAARLTGARDIYIQHGEYHEMVLLEAAGVGLYGGYDAAWQRIHERPSVVRAAPAPPEATVVVSGSAGASLTRLRIVSEGCTGDAPTVYGVRVTGSTGVRIEDCEVMVGPGCDAGDVEDAADAGTSESGHDGASGKKDGSGGTGGDGGQGCGDGGAGGLGGHGDVPPQAGADAPGGGSGGSAPANGCHTRGADGAPGTPGVNGFQGSGGDGTGGVFGPGFWVGSPGAAGAAGTPGTPGGGGSGGGGTSKCQGCGVCEVFGQCVCQAERGGGGGGGGGGGCGGPEGPGGKAGGGSIGILIHESDVTCLDNTVRTGMGGHGGKGGDGGLLGLGGIGGTGGGGYGGAGDGGTGGTGGWGGEGGGGGGGAGGVSIAIVLWKALTSGPDGLSAQNDLIPGSGGEGGSAGLFGKPSTMAPGLPGKSAEVLDLGAGM